jgi:thioredoxin-dependent peroxiredoxin
MKRVLMAALVSAMMAVPVLAALKQGERAPEFSTKASLAGKTLDFSLKSALQKGPVVVYFYPSAFTAGCNIEAHTFAENKEKFDAAGASIIGVSRDSLERLNAFSADPEYCAGKIEVASDADGAIADSYGLTKAAVRPGMKDSRGVVIDHDFTERTTFIVRRDGTIADVFSTSDDKISPADHVTKALAAVQQLAGR